MLFDLRYAFRQLFKNPGFTIVALLTLALGIGINTTTFTLVNVFMYRVPPYPDPDRLVNVFSTMPQSQFSRLAPANARDVVEQSTVFEQPSPWCYAFSNLAQPGQPAERVVGLAVAGNFFSTLGVAPMMGRVFTPADDRPGHNDVIVVSERFWKERLGGDPHAIGIILRLDGKPVTVAGVMPESCQDYISWGPVDTWQPLGYGEDNWRIRNNDWMDFVARLKPGVSLAQAQSQLSTIAAHLAQDHPETNSQRGLKIAPYGSARSHGAGVILWTIMGLMLFVLLIACVNLANLQLARTAGRMREYAIRVALGASRGQLVRQLLAESVLLSLAGGALGLMVAVWGNRLLGSRIQMNADSEAGLNLPLDYRVLGFTLAASVATGIIFGLMPGWVASRTDVISTVKQGGRGTAGDRSKHRMRKALVVAELALALASLVGAAYFVRGIQRLGQLESGWQGGNLVTGSFVLPSSTYSNDDQTRSAVDRLGTGLAQLPGVDRVAISGEIPIYSFSHRANFTIEGRPPPQKGLEPLALAERVTPGYFSTLGIHLLGGRDFAAADRADSRQVVIINSAMARQFWPRGDAIGHRIGSADPKNPQWKEIVGIVNDIRLAPGTPAPLTRFQIYRPIAQDPDHWLTFTLHSKGVPAGLADAARRAVARVDPDLAVYSLGTVDLFTERSVANDVLVRNLLTIAAVLGLFLALVGIYGVIANLAVQRTQEIGIRMALGARTGSVIWLVLRDGARLAGIGTAIGLVLAFWLSRGLSLAMPEIPGHDPAIMIGLAGLLVVATLFACCLPALRATRVNPVDALRAE
jgi:predicted permease